MLVSDQVAPEAMLKVTVPLPVWRTLRRSLTVVVAVGRSTW